MQRDWLRRFRRVWVWYSHVDTALGVPSRIALTGAAIVAASYFVSRNWELTTWLILTLALLVTAAMWFIERRRRLDAERESGSAVAAERAPQAIEIEPRVERDWDYGPRGDASAYLVAARVKSVDGKVHSAATGTLVSVEPLDGEMKVLYEARGAFPSGVLRWSSHYGSDDQARITPAGVDLDIFVFEGTDERGTAAYRDDSLRLRGDQILLDGYNWRVTIEVATERSSVQCVFDVSAGKRDPRNPLVIPASPEGTLYPPEITVRS